MSSKSMHELFVEEIKDIYNAEKQITKAMPRIIKKVNSENLRKALEMHLKQTEKQIERVEKIFQELNMPPKGRKCIAMEGIIQEARELVDENYDEMVLDAGIIAAAQKIEHYEMSAYGSARSFASHLGLKNIVSILQETLNEEKETDQKLTQLAESEVNVEAMSQHT